MCDGCYGSVLALLGLVACEFGVSVTLPCGSSQREALLGLCCCFVPALATPPPLAIPPLVKTPEANIVGFLLSVSR